MSGPVRPAVSTGGVVLDNAAIAALLAATGLAAAVLLLCIPAIHARTGRKLSARIRQQRALGLIEAIGSMQARRRDGAVNATSLVRDSGDSNRERYQVLRFAIDAGWAERCNFVGPSLLPSYLRLTDAGWNECVALRASREDHTRPPSATVTYLSNVPGPGGPVVDDDLVAGPTDQHLRELYVALRADAREIYQQGLRADANECADEVERAMDAGDRRAQWEAVDRAGHLVALAASDFDLTQLVLKRLFGGVPGEPGEHCDAGDAAGLGEEQTTTSGRWDPTG